MAEYEEGGVDPAHLGHAVDQGLQVVDAVVDLLTIPVSFDQLPVGIVLLEPVYDDHDVNETTE